MAPPVLLAGERWLIRSRDVSIKGAPFHACLTSLRVILQSARDSPGITRDLALNRIAGIAPTIDRTGEPVLVISARSSSGDFRRLVIAFPALLSRPARTDERNAWYRALAGIVSGPAAAVPGNPPLPVRPAGLAARPYCCTACGRQIPPGSEFCDRCGARVTPTDRIAASVRRGSAGTAGLPETAVRQRHGISGESAHCRPIVLPEPLHHGRQGAITNPYPPVREPRSASGRKAHVRPVTSPLSAGNPGGSRRHRFAFPAAAAAMVGCIAAGVFMLVSPVGFARLAGTILQALFFFR